MSHFDFDSPNRLPQPGEPAVLDHPDGEPQHIGEIEKLISELSDQQKQDLYILLKIAQREGWSLWTTNKEMGYFPLDMPLISAIDRASRSPAQWLHFFYVFGGKSVKEDAQLNL